ncbi:MAG TPA: DNA-formamidopyrimidine glycosylase family protein [Myxococcota bacterium]|nr:DNA-formamidopyrimidine glycosylase family protein [Myxococcota bacterium]
MPEGDALHRTAARLQVLVGSRIAAESPNPRGAATGVAGGVDGRVLESVEAVGKHLLLRFEGGVTLRSHLRMSGRWRVGPRGTEWLGRPWLVLRGSAWEAAQWNGPVLTLEARPVRRLGPDLLAAATDVADVVARVKRADPDRLLGDALVDQRLVAGIGNMWLAEALWHARVSPWLTLGGTATAELHAVLTFAQEAMRASVRGARRERAVHRRAGRPCPRCGEPIRSRGLGDANRIAYWCARCQREGDASPPP